MDGEVTVDGRWFADQSRYQSPALVRAFSAIRGVAEAAQSELLSPHEVALDVVSSEDADIVRGVD